MLLWAWSMAEEVRMGLTHKQFAKYAFMRLGIQNDTSNPFFKSLPFEMVSILPAQSRFEISPNHVS
jgi:hypothetical protein